MPNAVDTTAPADRSVEGSADHPTDLPTTAAPAGTAALPATVAEETIVEEISIDGMCGVY
jgi:mycofactocin precursor